MDSFLSTSSHCGVGVGDRTTRASSSSAPPPRQNYEVFLSFRGEDTRHGFTDHLYRRLVDRGIMVFRDNEELRVGERIDQLFEAIKASRISIPIISPDYASSIWCLKELLQILDCMKTSGQLVLPIFYHVKPSDIREQKGDFGKKFRMLRKHYALDGKFVQDLGNAFIEVATLKGWEADKTAGGDDGELVKLVVARIFNELGKAELLVPDFLIGVEHHVEKLKEMMDTIPSKEAKIIAIHGMGGIGKTTLAKALYNSLSNNFECCSFVPNIREGSKNKGMEVLQKQMIFDILVDGSQREISDVDEGITIIEKSFKGKRLLLLLDDVEDKDQLNKLAAKNSWFGSESIVVITTRNKDVTVASSVNLSYELNELNSDQSYELFHKHAFGRDNSCPEDLEMVARDIISTMGGLPMAIEVIGSLLYGKSKDFWRGTLEKLRKKPNATVGEKLKVSYDALAYEQQQMFLDIACLPFWGDQFEFACYMWKSCGFYPKQGIEILMSLSLIKKIGPGNRLVMHDQLKDLGREIVRREGYNNIGERSRILNEEAMEVIQRKQGTNRVQALSLISPTGQPTHCTSQQFQDMSNLRFLQMGNVHLRGDFENLFRNLRWLWWASLTGSDCIDIMGINFNPKRLVVLELTNSNIRENWMGWSQMTKLKVLKLMDCHQLTTTPDFSALNELEVLILNHCGKLKKVHPSIVNINKSLKTLNVAYCKQLEELPIEVGKMTELRELVVDSTGIREIPVSEGYLTKLEILSAKECTQLTDIPVSIGSLVKLRYLRLSDTCIRQLPASIGDLYNLEELSISETGIKCLPTSIGMLESLTMLNLSWTNITQLPESVGGLYNLKELFMSHTDIKCLPTSIGMLSKLQELDLAECKKLESLPGLPCSLTSLKFSGDLMETLPEFSILTSLSHLTYKDLFQRRRILNLGKLNHLETLNILNSELHIKALYDPEFPNNYISGSKEEIDLAPENFNLLLELPLSLVQLTVIGCQTLRTLPNLSNLKNLSILYLWKCPMLMEINGLEGVESLEDLHISGCHPEIKFPDLSRLRNLKYLSINSYGLMEIPGLQKLQSLKILDISGCKSLQYLPDFSQFINLEILDVRFCEKLTEIRGLENLTSLHMLDVRGCTALTRLPHISAVVRFDPLEDEKESDMNFELLEGMEKNESDSYPFEGKEETESEKLTEIEGPDNLTSLRKSDLMLPWKIFMKCLHERMEILGIKISAMDGDGMQVDDIGNIFIPIISKSFVSSATCLYMLEHMVERQRKSTDTHIFPIFFAVTLSEFKDELRPWKDALMEVENIGGWFVPEIYTSEEINSQAKAACQMILQKLKWIQLSMGYRLVKIDDHVDRILNLLDLEVNDVQAVWIWGQDGVGKTTLARAIYHRLCSGFEACCFLGEIDVRTRHSSEGIQLLQSKMVSDLLHREMEVMENITEGINLISERFCHMKVLIVLDDVTDDSYLEALAGHLYWFGPGSRIIITARENCSIKVTPPAQSYEISFDLPGKHEDTLVQVFAVNAFRRTDPPEDFDILSREFVRILDPYRGLPLSIEILGSFLHGKSVAEWTSELQSLKEGYSQNYVDTEKIISMSYDSLNETQKQIFLDISCFPHGIDSRIVSSFCHGSLQSPTVDDFEVLVLLSLVKIDDDKGIWMHRIVRDFGRKIVDCINRQGGKQGIQEVEVSDSHTSPELTRMPDRTFLKLYEENIYSDFDTELAGLRGLIWQRSSSELHLQFEKEVVVDFSWCKNWTGCRLIMGSKLRVLNLTGCIGLLETPDFSHCKNLEMLILEHCSRLVMINTSIQHLQHLVTLNLKYCTELTVLPNEVGQLKALKELHFDGTSIQEIPIAIGNLKNLQILTASNCSSLDHLPQSACDLLSITELKLDFTSITELPYLIWKRMKLQHLSLRECRCIKILPPFDGYAASSLKELDLSGTSISELPLSIVKLKSLSVLKLDFSFISEFPPDFGELKQLEEIHASWCRNLEYLPKDIEKLESLRVIKVGFSSISSIPVSIQRLTSLETLDCTSCNKLKTLPELPSSLTSLYLQLTGPKALPDFLNLKRLRELALESSSLRTSSPKHRVLPTLPDSLRKLSLCCAMLEDMPRLPSKLVLLSVRDCRLLRKLPTMKPLQNLLEMEILHCSKIKKIEGLGGHKALRILKISDCGIKSLQGLDKLISLKKLTLHDCQLLGNLCVKSLRNLMELEILKCPKVKKIEGLGGLKALRILKISDSRIKSLEELDKLTSLTILSLRDCPSLGNLNKEHLQDQIELEILRCPKIENRRP